MVDDFGTVINPLMLEGQVHGGIAQGIGQALHEHAAFDEQGQLVAGSLMDYTLPRADVLPRFDRFPQHRRKNNVLGVKGRASRCHRRAAGGDLGADGCARRNPCRHAGNAGGIWRALHGFCRFDEAAE